ncbi:MAG: homocysteine S-methyltransferase family protein [Atopobiaceae bacterium]
MRASQTWERTAFDDANDQIAAELGTGLSQGTKRFVLSGDPAQILDQETRQLGIAPALWDISDEEGLAQAHQLFADAGADVALTNTWGCGPAGLKRLGVQATVDQVCDRAVRAALSCSPAAVAGQVGVGKAVAGVRAKDEAYQLGTALLHQGAHLLVVGGTQDEDALQSMVEGAARANDGQAVARPIVAALTGRLAAVVSEPFVSVLQQESDDALAGLLVGPLDIAGPEGAMRAVDSVAAVAQKRGLSFGVSLCSADYREMDLVEVAHRVVAGGASFLRGSAGIPIAGTTVLAEALEG